jgi:tetratricopeptide (TPR) repeat protein
MNGFIWSTFLGAWLSRSLFVTEVSPRLFCTFPDLLTQISAQTSFEDRLIEGMDRGMQGDYQGAIAIFSRLIREYPQAAEVYYNRGLARQKLGDQKGAIADYNRAIKLDQKLAEAYQARGLLKQEQRKLTEALGDLQQAARLYQAQNNITSYEALQPKIQELLILKKQEK